jgi:hypothetical protein
VNENEKGPDDGSGPPPPEDAFPEEEDALPEGEAEAASPEGPALARTPEWVPSAVVAGAVFTALGFFVSRIRPEAGGDAYAVVGHLAGVVLALGVLSLLGGYFAYLLSRRGFASALEALVLSAVSLLCYGVGWAVVFGTLSGDAPSIFFVKPLGLEGKGAALAAIAGLAACVALFALSFRWAAGIAWPHFRAGVALNVLAMLHLVVFVLGAASYVNVTFVPRWLGSGIDLTATAQHTLSEKTRAVLGKVDGELQVLLIDYSGQRRSSSPLTPRVRDLLLRFEAACPGLKFRSMDALRSGTELLNGLKELRLEEVLDDVSGDEDVVVLGYRPPGEKLFARTRVVPVNADLVDVSALGVQRFKAEGVLTNAVNEVVFTQKKVVFLSGHGERAGTEPSATGGASASILAEALRGDNFAVSTLDLSREPVVPAGTDLLVCIGPTVPFKPAEAEAVASYLRKGGAMILLTDMPQDPEAPTGLEELLASFGVAPRRDAVIISYVVEETMLQGSQAMAIDTVFSGADEYGSHPATAAVSRVRSPAAFRRAIPVFKAEKVPDGVEVREMAYAPRDLRGYRPFAALRRKGRARLDVQEPGDVADRRLPLLVSAERKTGETDRGGGRIVVAGDADFATDAFLDPRSPQSAPANRTLLLNAASWLVRRDLIAVDPKAVESEYVPLKAADRDLAFYAAVLVLPILSLGVAVGVWWTRRR